MSSVVKEQRLQDHFVVLCNDLDVDVIVPFLRNEHMLTQNEVETLSNPFFTSRVRREKLLLMLPRKGKKHFEKFAECLVWSGQRSLARKIGVEVNKIPPSPYPSQATSSGISAMQQNEFFRILQSMIPGPDLHPAISNQVPTPIPIVPFSHSSPPNIASQQLPNEPSARQYDIPISSSQPPLQPHLESSVVYQPPAPRLDRQRSHPKDVFLLYCNEPSDFSDDVILLADMLVKCFGNDLKIHFDGYDNYEDPSNWFRWTESHIMHSDLVILICSHILIQKLHSQSSELVPMKRGVFNADAIFNLISPQKFIPVFINVNQDQDRVPNVRSEPYISCVPPSLRGSTCYWLNLRALTDAIGDIENMDAQLMQKLTGLLQEQRFQGIASLMYRLLGNSFTPQPTPANIPLYQPGPAAPSVLPSRLPEVTISEEELMIIAERIPREWQRLGIALGIQYSVLESIRRKHSSDTLAASMEMFATWQRLKGDKATRIALKEALNFLNYGRLVQELFEKD